MWMKSFKVLAQAFVRKLPPTNNLNNPPLVNKI